MKRTSTPASVRKTRYRIVGLFFLCLALGVTLKWGEPDFLEMILQHWGPYAFSPLVVFGLVLGYQSIIKSEISGLPVLVVGSGRGVEAVKKAFSQRKIPQYRVYYLDWHGQAEELCQKLQDLVSRHRIRKIVIAMENDQGHLPKDLLLHFRVQGIQIIGVVRFYEQAFGKMWVESIQPDDLIFGGGFNRQTVIAVMKRTIDLASAVFGLIIFSPMFVLLPILIKLDSKGSVFYQQERIGEKGRPFKILKFRSMFQDAELKTGAVWATENDPRVTRVGKVMRKTRLDELPQLINILKGEMSFVGPRPERQVFIEVLEKTVPYYALRHAVKPGLTGWAQVCYRYGSSEEDALEKHNYDLYYVKHLSPLFDLSIIFSTIRVVCVGKGAR